MAPPTIPLPSSLSSPNGNLILPTPLTPSGFAPFGTAIVSPLPRNLTTPPSRSSISSLSGSSASGQTPSVANQGSALRFGEISTYTETYINAPSAVASSHFPGDDVGPPTSKGRPAMSMFCCFPRRELKTRRAVGSAGSVGRGRDMKTFPVEILERHPYTTQTFTPFNATKTSTHDKGAAAAKYLVIVAPSLSTPLMATNTPPDGTSETQVQISNPPDLANIRAFVAEPGMAVTYGVGTWHAPMVVLGEERIDFVVVQWVSGVASEDCQEVCFGGGADGDGGPEVVVDGLEGENGGPGSQINDVLGGASHGSEPNKGRGSDCRL